MMNHKSTIIYFIIFALICIASVFILRLTHHAVAVIVNKNTINSYFNQATFIAYNKQGQIEKKIKSEKVTHFELEKTTLFDKPFIINYSLNRIPWHIHADKALSNGAGDKIILTGHVIIRRMPTSKKPAITLTTTQLTLFPKTSRAKTDKLVTITRPGTTISGVGLTADFKTGEYQLLSATKTIYRPEKR